VTAIKRREFLAGLGSAALFSALPRPASAQSPGKVYRVGYLQTAARDFQGHLIHAFEDGLRELGWRIGQNLLVEYRFANGKSERLDQLAKELVDLNVDVIVTGVESNTLAARRATSSIPIVMAVSHDPVGAGLIDSVARPGANVTGLMASVSHEIHGKRLQLLGELAPPMTLVAALWNPSLGFNAPQLEALTASAKTLGVAISPLAWETTSDLRNGFAALAQQRVQGIVVLDGPLQLQQRHLIAALALAHQLPSVLPRREGVDAGGLLSYGASLRDLFRYSATYVDRILKGANPAEMPVEQPARYELVINLQTAKALDLTIPPTLLARADEVIE
jgi:putative tryptophan/tyrosine transport system substrate-binding protein